MENVTCYSYKLLLKSNLLTALLVTSSYPTLSAVFSFWRINVLIDVVKTEKIYTVCIYFLW